MKRFYVRGDGASMWWLEIGDGRAVVRPHWGRVLVTLGLARLRRPRVFTPEAWSVRSRRGRLFRRTVLFRLARVEGRPFNFMDPTDRYNAAIIDAFKAEGFEVE